MLSFIVEVNYITNEVVQQNREKKVYKDSIEQLWEDFMKISKKAIIGVVVVGAGLFVFSGVLRNAENAKAALYDGPKAGTLVNVGRANKKDIQTKVSASGTLEAKDQEMIFAQTNAKVMSVTKKVGDLVTKGEVLFILDEEEKEKKQKELETLLINIENKKISIAQNQTTSKQEVLSAETKLKELEKTRLDYEEKIRSTKVSIEVAKQEIETAQREYTLAKALYEENLGSKKEVEDKEKAVSIAKEKVVELENSKNLVQQSLENLSLQQQSAQYSLDILLNVAEDKTKAQTIAMLQNDIKSLEIQKEELLKEIDKIVKEIAAPMDGIVLEIEPKEGSYITKGQKLVTIVDPNTLVVKSDISPFYASQLKEGLVANIKYNGSETIEIEGLITKVSPTAVSKVSSGGNQTTVIPVEIEVDNKDSALKPGLTVDIRITTEEVSDVIAIPILATMDDGDEGATYVLIVKEDYTIEKRYVNQGAADNLWIQVEGVEEGEVVITNPTEALTEGMVIKHTPISE